MHTNIHTLASMSKTCPSARTEIMRPKYSLCVITAGACERPCNIYIYIACKEFGIVTHKIHPILMINVVVVVVVDDDAKWFTC